MRHKTKATAPDERHAATERENTKSAYLISPVQRALRLLDFIANGGTTTQLTRLAKELDINRVTLSRLLDTLEHEGMIEPHPGGAGYQAGMRLLAMSAAALGDRDLVRLAKPMLAKLAAETQLSAHLAVISGAEMIYLLQELPNTLLVSNIRVGTRLPVHVTSAGRVMLADMPAKARRALLGKGPLSSVTQHTPTSHAELDRMIAEDVARGCAWSHSGYETGINACAAPVRDQEGRAVAAISVAGPESRFDPSNSPGTERAVIATAQLLSKLLGYRPAQSRSPADAATASQHR